MHTYDAKMTNMTLPGQRLHKILPKVQQINANAEEEESGFWPMILTLFYKIRLVQKQKITKKHMQRKT